MLTKIITKTFKGIWFLVFALLISPLIILSIFEKWFTNNEGFFLFGGHLLALLPGSIGRLTRTSYYFFTLKKFSLNSSLGFGSLIYKRETRVFDNLHTASYCTIGLADFHSDVAIENRVSIISGLHEHGSSSNVEKKEYGQVITQRVVIGKKCWLGEGSIVGADVGANSIISVGAVVIKPVPEGCMAMGNPARSIKGGWGKHILNNNNNNNNNNSKENIWKTT